MSKVNWNGAALAQRVRKATIEAVDETTEAAAQSARSSHWWRARRGRRGLAGEIKTEAATVEDGKVVGAFGSTQRRGFHGLFHERRSPFLRPAADREFPGVSERIRKRLD